MYFGTYVSPLRLVWNDFIDCFLHLRYGQLILWWVIHISQYLRPIWNSQNRFGLWWLIVICGCIIVGLILGWCIYLSLYPRYIWIRLGERVLCSQGEAKSRSNSSTRLATIESVLAKQAEKWLSTLCISATATWETSLFTVSTSKLWCYFSDFTGKN